MPPFSNTDALLATATELAAKFAARAAQHDSQGTFPLENYADARASGYPLVTVPKHLGGYGASLLEAVQAQSIIAEGDGSTALALAMHVQTIGMAAANNEWDPAIFAEICGQIAARGALINSCASEPELGSPSRGGKPQTTARKQGGGWLISGHKTFASMAPALDYFIVPAALIGEDGAEQDATARFLVARQADGQLPAGMRIAETWDSLGMRGTGSHDLYFADVFVPDRYCLVQSALRPAASTAAAAPAKANFNIWFTLCVSAVYLGVGRAAQNTILAYAQARVPTALAAPIASLESVQGRLGHNAYTLHLAQAALERAATYYDSHWLQRRAEPAFQQEIQAQIIMAKLAATNAAISVTDSAMRIAGGISMTHQLPLERYYRDARAGLFHPPADDSAYPMLGRMALTNSAKF
jgi:alkylation response protein AidB-like acyl-CoA dehydrogenase